MIPKWAKFLLTAVFLLLSACASKQPDPSGLTQKTAPSTATLPTIRQAVTSTPTNTMVPTEPLPTATILPTETLPAATHTPTATLSPTVTVIPTATSPPTETMVPTTVASDAVAPATVNGVPVAEIAILSPEVRDNVRRIFLEGRQIGRDAHAFSKLGDSVTLTDHYLTRFDSGHFNLGPYAYLQPAIDHYSGSFARYGVASRVGLHAWAIFDPLWANKEWCLPDEHMVACEIRLNNPSVLLIKIGSNDSGAATIFEENLRLLLEFTIENGVVPILATKADRFEGPDDRNNGIFRQLAQEYAVPLWDYDRAAGTLPRRGLSGDEVHMTMADADDYTKPETYERGYPIADLTALMTLYEVMREVEAASDA